MSELKKWNKFFAIEPPPHEAILIGFYNIASIILSLTGNKKIPTWNEFYPFWQQQDEQTKRGVMEGFKSMVKFIEDRDGKKK